jgi:hypothetical protein
MLSEKRNTNATKRIVCSSIALFGGSAAHTLKNFEDSLALSQDRIRLELSNLLSAQSLENGFVWQNLVASCHAHYTSVVGGEIAKAREGMRAEFQQLVKQLVAVEFAERLAGGALEPKARLSAEQSACL